MHFQDKSNMIFAALVPYIAFVQCAPTTTISVSACTSTITPTVTPVQQISDGQVQAPTNAAQNASTMIFNSTIVPTVTPVQQVSDGQVQTPTDNAQNASTMIFNSTIAPTVTPVQQVSDGQVQASTDIAQNASTTTSDSATDPVPTPVPTPNSPSFKNFTAIGDSYTAGDGDFAAVPGDATPECKRTLASYAYQFFNQFVQDPQRQLSSFNFPACSGADTNVITAQVDSGSLTTALPQIGFSFGTPDLVSITAGGDNGEAFVKVIAGCVVLNLLCQFFLDFAAGIIAGIQPALEALYTDAKTRNLLPGQNRQVFVLGYARFYNIDADINICKAVGGGQNFNIPTLGPDSVAKKMNDLVVAMNSKIQAAAAAVGVSYVDIDDSFEGHRICDVPDAGVEFQDSLEGYRFVSGYAPFHPTEAGHGSMMRDLARAVGYTV